MTYVKQTDLTPYPLHPATQTQMLRRLAMFWDGQWFLKSVEAFGIDAAIALNARVRTSFGRMEMRTMLRALGKEHADDLTDALRLVMTHGQLLLGEGLMAEIYQDGEEAAYLVVHRCAAYEGAKLAKLPRSDAPCVACETLWAAWLETLLPGNAVTVEYPRRQGRGSPDCLFAIGVRPLSAR